MPPIRRSDSHQLRLLTPTRSSQHTSISSVNVSGYSVTTTTNARHEHLTPPTNTSTPSASYPASSATTSQNTNTTQQYHLRKCLGCKQFLPSYLLIALFPKSTHDYKEKCIKCRRSMDAVGDYVKTHGDQDGRLSLRKQFEHLKAQSEVLEKWTANLAKMGVNVEEAWIDEAIEAVREHPALSDAKVWIEERSNNNLDGDTFSTLLTVAPKPNTPILIHPKHLALLSPEPTPTPTSRRIVQLRLPQRPSKMPYFLSAANTQAQPQRRSTRPAGFRNRLAGKDKKTQAGEDDFALTSIGNWTGIVGSSEESMSGWKKEAWTAGMNEAEIMAVEGLMRMSRDVDGVGLRQMRFVRQRK